jgi:hypothetical protein
MRFSSNSIKHTFLLFLVGALCYPCYLQARSSKAETLIVVPARERTIKLAIDLAQMRKNVSVVTFRLPVKAKSDPVFFLWEKGSWQPIMYDDFCEMKCLTKLPGKVMIIGDNEAIPNSVINAMPWAEKTVRIPTFVIADIINQLDAHFAFTEKEWKKLAANHGLILQDLNAEKRKFNPYDIPRSKLPLDIIPAHQSESAIIEQSSSSDEPKIKMPEMEEPLVPISSEIEGKAAPKDELPPK